MSNLPPQFNVEPRKLSHAGLPNAQGQIYCPPGYVQITESHPFITSKLLRFHEGSVGNCYERTEVMQDVTNALKELGAKGVNISEEDITKIGDLTNRYAELSAKLGDLAKQYNALQTVIETVVTGEPGEGDIAASIASNQPTAKSQHAVVTLKEAEASAQAASLQPALVNVAAAAAEQALKDCRSFTAAACDLTRCRVQDDACIPLETLGNAPPVNLPPRLEAAEETEEAMKRAEELALELEEVEPLGPLTAAMSEPPKPCGGRAQTECSDPCEWDEATSDCYDMKKNLPADILPPRETSQIPIFKTEMGPEPPKACGGRAQTQCVEPCEWDVETNDCYDKALPPEFAPPQAIEAAAARAEAALQECSAFTNEELCIKANQCDWQEETCTTKAAVVPKAIAEQKLDGKHVVVISEIPGHRLENGAIVLPLSAGLRASQVKSEVAKQLFLPESAFGFKTSLFGGKVVKIQNWEQPASTATSGGKSVLIAYPVGEVSTYIVDVLTGSQIEATFPSDTTVNQIKECIASAWQVPKADQRLMLTDSTAAMFEAMSKYPPQCVSELSKDSNEACANKTDERGNLMDPISLDVIEPKNLMRIRCNGKLFCYDVESLKEGQAIHDRQKTRMSEPTSRTPFSDMLSAKLRGQPTLIPLDVDTDALGDKTSDLLVMIQLTRPQTLAAGPLSQNTKQATIKGCGAPVEAPVLPECLMLLEGLQFTRPQIEKWVSELKATNQDVLAKCRNLRSTIDRCKDEIGFKDYSFVPLMVEQEKWDIPTFIAQCETKEKTLANPFVTARCTQLLTPLTNLTPDQLNAWYRSLSAVGKTVFTECQNLPGAIEQCKKDLDLNDEQAGALIAQYMEQGYDARQMLVECKKTRDQLMSGFVKIDETPEQIAQAENEKLSWWQRFKLYLDRKKEERKAKKELYDQQKAQRDFDAAFVGKKPLKEDTSFFENLFPGEIRNKADKPLDWKYKAEKPLDWKYKVEKPFDWNYKPEPSESWTDKIKNFFKSDDNKLKGTSALFDLALASPGAAYKARDIVVGLERKTLDELIRVISELIALLGSDEAIKILKQTRTSVIGELDKMCLRRGWALFDEVAKQCVPLVEEAAKVVPKAAEPYKAPAPKEPPAPPKPYDQPYKLDYQPYKPPAPPKPYYEPYKPLAPKPYGDDYNENLPPAYDFKF